MPLSKKAQEILLIAQEKFPCTITGCEADLLKIEEQLNIFLSEEFKELYTSYTYECFKMFEFISFPEGIIQETLRFRKDAKLPADTVILSEDDASLVLLKCLGKVEKVYWIAIEDYESYCHNEPLKYNSSIFANFSDFFNFLLNNEE